MNAIKEFCVLQLDLDDVCVCALLPAHLGLHGGEARGEDDEGEEHGGWRCGAWQGRPKTAWLTAQTRSNCSAAPRVQYTHTHRRSLGVERLYDKIKNIVKYV